MNQSTHVSLDMKGSTKETWGIAIDYITGKKRAERALSFISSASLLIENEGTNDEHLEKLTNMFVPYFADLAQIDLLDSEDGLYQAAKSVSAVITPTLEKNANTYLYPYISPVSHGVSNVIKTGSFESKSLTDDVGDEPKDKYQKWFFESSFKSVVIIPVKFRQKVIGTLSLFSHSDGRAKKYTKIDLVVMEQIARLIAMERFLPSRQIS